MEVSNPEIIQVMFTYLNREIERGKEYEVYSCKMCPSDRKYRCLVGKGRGNVVSHLTKTSSHPQWKETFSKLKKGATYVQQDISKFLNTKIYDRYNWLRITVLENLPFHCCESVNMRDIVKMGKISYESLVKYRYHIFLTLGP